MASDAANTIHSMNTNATNEEMILPSEIILSLQNLARGLEIAKRGSISTGLHNVHNPNAKGRTLLQVADVLEKNNWTLPGSVGASPMLHRACKGVDFKSGLLDPMSYPDSLNGVAEELSQGTIDFEDIGNYREFLLLLAGDLLAI